MNTPSLICRRLSNIGCKLKSVSSLPNLLKSPVSASPSPMRISRRLPVESSCLMTMLPLHSAIASARLQSVLSVDSQSWCLVPQVSAGVPSKLVSTWKFHYWFSPSSLVWFRDELVEFSANESP
ncbi:hypothetical protein KSS87_020179 [Heliosperma pusillum]|nr:hypothetical protein KSS87_020179 [Heliosperma pusillum]